MDGMQRVYRTLFVSANPSFTQALLTMLPEKRFQVTCAASDAQARQEAARRDYDLVLVNTPLPDDFGSALAQDLSKRKGTVALVFLRHEVYAELADKLTPQGVFTFSKPAPMQNVALALDFLCSARERLRALEEKSVRTEEKMEEKMEEIRLINHAKWILIRELKMEEPEAHRYLEKQAMDRSLSRRDVAQKVIQTYEH